MRCPICRRPSARLLCGRCRAARLGISVVGGLVDDTVRMDQLPPAPDEWDATVVVDGYRPPVPGKRP
jgi:hypothetical protein